MDQVNEFYKLKEGWVDPLAKQNNSGREQVYLLFIAFHVTIYNWAYIRKIKLF